MVLQHLFGLIMWVHVTFTSRVISQTMRHPCDGFGTGDPIFENIIKFGHILTVKQKVSPMYIFLYIEQTPPTRMSALQKRAVAGIVHKGNCYLACFSFRTGNSGVA